jgi:hypothetical protein
MESFMKFAVFVVCLVAALPVRAEPLNLPVQLDYGLIAKLVGDSLYQGTGHSAEIWRDKNQCSFLKLANLKIDGKDEQIRLANDVEVQYGTKLGGQCIPVLLWQGALETLQQPVLSEDKAVLSLPVTQLAAYDKQGRKVDIGQLQALLKSVAEPKMAALSIDLKRLQNDMTHNVSSWLPPQEAEEISRLLGTLKFNGATANERGIDLQLGLDVPTQAQAPSAPLTLAEQQQWQVIWQEWENSLAQTISGIGKDGKGQALQSALNSALRSARTAAQAGLTQTDPGQSDPVRDFFNQSWHNLAPELRQFSKDMPGQNSFDYLSLIAAADAVYKLENKIAPLGITFTSDGLRKLARLLIAGKHQAVLTPTLP